MSKTYTNAQRLAVGLLDIGAFLPGPASPTRDLMRVVISCVEEGRGHDGFQVALAAVHKAVDSAIRKGSFDPEICLLAGFYALVLCDGQR